MAEMVAGTASQRDRWQTALQMPVIGVISAAHLTEFEESGSSAAAAGGIPAGSVIVNARFVPRLSGRPPPNDGGDASADLWMSGGRVAAVRTSREDRKS